jgi:hypothetical protein
MFFQIVDVLDDIVDVFFQFDVSDDIVDVFPVC